MSGSKAMLDKVDFFRSLNFKDLEKLVEFNDGLPKELKNPPWRVPTNIPKEKVINHILGEFLSNVQILTVCFQT